MTTIRAKEEVSGGANVAESLFSYFHVPERNRLQASFADALKVLPGKSPPMQGLSFS